MEEKYQTCFDEEEFTETIQATQNDGGQAHIITEIHKVATR